MPISIRRSIACAVLLCLTCASAWAAELDVRLEPDNRALRQNVENYIGALGERDERELLRYSRIAHRQAEKALQALGYYQAQIDSQVQGGETPRLILRIQPGEPVRLRNVRVQVEGPAAQQATFRVPQRLHSGEVLDHGLNWTRHWVNPQGHSYGAETELSAPRQNVGLYYDVPLDPPLTDKLRYVAGYQYEELADTDSLSRLLKLGPEWHSELPSGWQRVLSLKWQHEEYRLGDDSGLSTLLMPGVAYSYLRSDSRIDPSEGYRLQFELAAAKDGVLSDANLVHANAQLRGLTTLGKRHRFLGRVQLGGNWTDEYVNVPPSLRYFAGGDQSVRGYDYQSLSPTNSDGDRIGGRYQFAASAEYQYSIAERWRVATFVDQGNAFNSLDFPTLKSSVGVGLRWVSPVGPIRIDLAHPLDGDTGVRLHFSMGPEL